MDKKGTIITAVTAILLVGAIGIFLANNPTSENSSNNATTQTRVATDPADIKNPGSFLEYSDAAFAKATESKKVLFFHSITCVVCDQIERNINAGVMPEDVAVFVVRLEKDKDVADKYNVNQQTTFVQVDNNGDALKEWNWLSKPFAGPQDIELEVV